MGPSRLRSHGWLRCLGPLSLFGFDAHSALLFCTYVVHLSSAFMFCSLFCIFVLQIGKFFIFGLLRLVWKYALCMIGCQPAEPGLEGSTHLRCYPSHAEAWVPPVYEATGGYAAPSPCLSSALTHVLHFCSALMLCI